jgi:alanyl aminopeptidase
VRLAIDPARPAFEGAIEIAGDVAERSSVIWLHGKKLRIAKAVARRGKSEVKLTVTAVGDDLLRIAAASALDPGSWTLAIEYAGDLDRVNTTGVFAQSVAGASYVFTKLEAIYARRVFPVFDEPDVKVPWQLTLDVPKSLVAVANTPQVFETALGETKRVEFAPTKPLPSYLIAFAVGPFELVEAGKSRGGTPIRIITPAKRAADGAWAAKTTGPLLDALEDWFGTPYPFEKLDMIAVPITVGWGAMENAGLITTAENLMLFDQTASHERKHRWVIVTAHEIAHQWFGNLVTMKFFDDLWLNEGFANWIESKVTGVIDPTYRDDQGELDVRNSALQADSLVSARKIRQPILTHDDISTAFDGITYAKGASVIAMFERYLGPEVFQQGVRDYLAARRGGNATSADFAAAIEKASGKPVGAAFSSFLEQPGAPEITATLQCTGSPQLTLTQQRYVPPGAPEARSATPWIVPICVAFDDGGERAEACTLLDREAATLALPVKACPRWAMLNAHGTGYYRVAYTTDQISALRDRGWGKLTWMERRALFFDLETAMKNGKLPMTRLAAFVPKLVAGNDRFTIGAVLDLMAQLELTIPDDLRPRYEKWLRWTFGAAARRLGFLPKPGDTFDIEERRRKLARTVGWDARDTRLVAEAVRLAENWRDLPQALRGLVLQIAVDARPAVFDRIYKEAATETERSRRDAIFAALAKVRDPVRQKKALAMVIDPAYDIRETRFMLFGGATDANRAVSREFFREHAEKILERSPKDGNGAPIAVYSYVFTSACDAEQRDEIASYVTATFSRAVGGERVVAQSIEAMDQCIARKKVLAPQLRTWLKSGTAKN